MMQIKKEIEWWENFRVTQVYTLKKESVTNAMFYYLNKNR